MRMILASQRVSRRRKRKSAFLRNFVRRLSRIKFFWISVGVVMLGLFANLGLRGLTLTQVQVTGRLNRVSEEKIRIRLTPFMGQPMATLPLKEIRDIVLMEPWVKEVWVRRQFLETVQIQTQEFEPVAFVKIGPRISYVDGEGALFGRPQRKAFDEGGLPKIELSWPVKEEGRIEEAVKLLLQAKILSMHGIQVTQVHYDPVLGFSLIGEDPILTITIGERGKEVNWERVIYLTHWLRQNNFEAKQIDLSCSDKAFIKS